MAGQRLRIPVIEAERALGIPSNSGQEVRAKPAGERLLVCRFNMRQEVGALFWRRRAWSSVRANQS